MRQTVPHGVKGKEAVNSVGTIATNGQSGSIPRLEANIIYRKCRDCEDERIHRKPVNFFTQQNHGEGAEVSPHVSSMIQGSRGGGAEFNGPVKTFMETRFGADFSDVRIHTDNDAGRSAGALRARAFTIGNDIFFNDGEYTPHSSSGKQLLAHELAHVLQNNANSSTLRRQPAVASPVLTPPTEQHYREFVQASISFLESSAQGFSLMNIDAAAVDRILNGWNVNASTVEGIILSHLDDNAALRTRYRSTYNSALRALINRASIRLNKPAARIYMENWYRIPEWAEFRLADIPATDQPAKRAVRCLKRCNVIC